MLADLAEAVRLAGLTDRQAEALTLVYDEDLTQGEAGKRMGGITKQAVEIYVSAACEKIADIYYYLASLGVGYVVGKLIEAEEIGDES